MLWKAPAGVPSCLCCSRGVDSGRSFLYSGERSAPTKTHDRKPLGTSSFPSLVYLGRAEPTEGAGPGGATATRPICRATACHFPSERIRVSVNRAGWASKVVLPAGVTAYPVILGRLVTTAASP